MRPAGRRPGRLRAVLVLGGAAVAGLAVGAAFQPDGSEEPPARARPLPDAPDESPQASQPLAPPPKPSAMLGLPLYPGANPAGFDGAVHAQGAAMELAWFETSDSVDDVLRWYEQQFSEGGFALVSHRFSGELGYAGYMESDSEVVHLITALAQDGRTYVFPSLSRPSEMIDAKADVPEGLPLPAQSESPMVVRVPGDGAEETNVVTKVPDASLPSLVSYYRKELEGRGWALAPVKQDRSGVLVEGQRPGGLVQVHLSHRTGSGPVEIFVRWRQEKAPAPRETR